MPIARFPLKNTKPRSAQGPRLCPRRMDLPPSRRRKACDLCTIKRIRCDGLKPLCTNCSLYGTECKMTTLSKPSATSRSSSVQKRKTAPERGGQMEQLEARLARIESLTQNIQGGSLPAQSQGINIIPPTGGGRYMTPRSNELPQSNGSPPGSVCTLDSNSSSNPQLQLPPIGTMMPTLTLYFRHYNSVIPLFDEIEFMRMLHGWNYQRSSAEWAAINVVLALGYRVIESRAVESPEVASCITNVRSVLMETMVRTDDLLGLQVLLGTVLLYQGTSRSLQHKDTPVLMGAAARAVQTLRLHVRPESKTMPSSVALHRSRLFWIAYILDKDTAVHFGVSPLLLDSDTDHVPPSPNPSDNVGNITMLDGTAFLNVFHARVQLGYMQARAHEWLLCARAADSPATERAKRRDILRTMLSHWLGAIPRDLLSGLSAGSLCVHSTQHLKSLLNVHLWCVLLAFRLHKENFSMITRLKSLTPHFPKADFEHLDPISHYENPLPDGWSVCVEHSRNALQLATVVGQPDYYLWHDSCSLFAGGIILLVNTAEYPDNENADNDQWLVDQSLDMYERLIEFGPWEKNSLRSDFYSLKTNAREAVTRSNEQRMAFETGSFLDDASPAGQLWNTGGWDIDHQGSMIPGPEAEVDPNMFPNLTTHTRR